MPLTGLHFLLTYQCTYECDHCFVWGSPWQTGTFTRQHLDALLDQASDLGTIRWIYFEGGEPFLYYPLLVHGVRRAHRAGFRVGIVSNAYWATTVADAEDWLAPLAGKVEDLSVSADSFHGEEAQRTQARNAAEAARRLGIPVDTLTVAPPTSAADHVVGQLPAGESAVMHRGRAAEKLAPAGPHRPWQTFDRCPFEDLERPARVHVDPAGYVHLCQGLVMGNAFEMPLKEMVARYAPREHPIMGPLLRGGPAELVRRWNVAHDETYADACHLCDASRRLLRPRFPGVLEPAQMYGVPG